MITNRFGTRNLAFELLALAARLRCQGKLALAFGAILAARRLRLGADHA